MTSALIIMPVGSDPNHQRRRRAIERGIALAGFIPIFPEYEPESSQFDMPLFCDQVRASEIVLADLTGERPSCYFELGVAQAFGRRTVMIAEAGTSIHQSDARETVSFYESFDTLELVLVNALRQLPPSITT